MAYQLVWTAEAENDFKNIIVYLKENWSIQSAQKFTIRTYKELEKLLAMPPIARPTSQQAFFLYRLDRKNALFFSLEGNY